MCESGEHCAGGFCCSPGVRAERAGSSIHARKSSRHRHGLRRVVVQNLVPEFLPAFIQPVEEVNTDSCIAEKGGHFEFSVFVFNDDVVIPAHLVERECKSL
jgi:hypothetical protein